MSVELIFFHVTVVCIFTIFVAWLFIWNTRRFVYKMYWQILPNEMYDFKIWDASYPLEACPVKNCHKTGFEKSANSVNLTLFFFVDLIYNLETCFWNFPPGFSLSIRHGSKITWTRFIKLTENATSLIWIRFSISLVKLEHNTSM